MKSNNASETSSTWSKNVPLQQVDNDKTITFDSMLSDIDYQTLDKRTKSIQSKLQIRRNEAPTKGIIDTEKSVRNSIEQRLIDNDTELQLLLCNGEEIITNIRVEHENRQQNYKIVKKNYDEVLTNFIENESVKIEAKLNEISDRWIELENVQDDVIKLPELLDQQKSEIAAIVDSKNKIIEKYQKDLEQLDVDYNAYQYKYSNDLYFFIKQINSNLDIMRKSYSTYFQLLSNVIDEERATLNLIEKQKWTKLSEQFTANQDVKEKLENCKRKFYEKEIDRIQFEHVQKTNRLRKQLLRDYEILQIDLEVMKIDCMKNVEKFDYNYQVLQKKNVENVTINNQERKRLSKCYEQLQQINKAISDEREKFVNLETSLIEDIHRFGERIEELENRAVCDSKSNDKKYDNIWQLHEKEAKNLLEKLLSIDKIITEQLLSIEWKQPDLSLIKREKIRSYRSAIETISEQEKSEARISQPELFGAYSCLSVACKENPIISDHYSDDCRQFNDKTKNNEKIADERIIRIILKKLCNSMGVIIEKDLIELLKPYDSRQTTLIKIDNLFKALGIKHLTEISSLIDYCTPYAWCPNCVESITPRSELSRHRLQYESDHEEQLLDTLSELQYSKCDDDINQSGQKSDISIQNIVYAETYSLTSSINDYVKNFDEKCEYKKAIGNLQPKDKQSIKSESKPCANHYLIIEAKYLMNALQLYTKTFINENQMDRVVTVIERLRRSRQTISRLLVNDDVERFWYRFQEIFSDNTKRTWKALEKGIGIYLKELQKRDTLDTECEYLRQQNYELKRILGEYYKK